LQQQEVRFILKPTIKNTAYGFLLGMVLFMIAPLGLGIPFIENLKPVLAPGIYLAQILIGDSAGPVQIGLAFILNGIIFALAFLGFSVAKSKTS